MVFFADNVLFLFLVAKFNIFTKEQQICACLSTLFPKLMGCAHRYVSSPRRHPLKHVYALLTIHPHVSTRDIFFGEDTSAQDSGRVERKKLVSEGHVRTRNYNSCATIAFKPLFTLCYIDVVVCFCMQTLFFWWWSQQSIFLQKESRFVRALTPSFRYICLMYSNISFPLSYMVKPMCVFVEKERNQSTCLRENRFWSAPSLKCIGK